MLNPLDQLQGTRVRTNDQHVPHVLAMAPKVREDPANHAAAGDDEYGGQGPEQDQKGSVHHPDLESQTKCSNDTGAERSRPGDVTRFVQPAGQALGSVQSHYTEQDVPDQRKTGEQDQVPELYPQLEEFCQADPPYTVIERQGRGGKRHHHQQQIKELDTV